jgi:hypothetical protein
MRLVHVLALAAAVALVPVANPGCSKYGEGSICDPNNTDPQTGISNDCLDGLVCTPGLCTDAAGICCPPAGHNITSPACQGMCAQGTGGANSGGSTTHTNDVGGFSPGNMKCPHDQCVIGVPLIAGYNLPMGKMCTDNGQCAKDEACADGMCEKTCATDKDCTVSDQRCINTLCRVAICSTCVNDICNGVTLKDGTVVPPDTECCGSHAWDMFCVEKVGTVCQQSCSMNTGGGGSGIGGSTPTGSGGAGGAAGATP